MFRVSGQRNKQKYGRVSSAVEKGKGLSSPSEKFLTFFFFCSRIIAIIEKFYLFPSSLFSFVRDSERKGGNLESIEKPVARELFADTCPWLIEHDITPVIYKLDIPWPRMYIVRVISFLFLTLISKYLRYFRDISLFHTPFSNVIKIRYRCTMRSKWSKTASRWRKRRGEFNLLR